MALRIMRLNEVKKLRGYRKQPSIDMKNRVASQPEFT